MTRRDYNPMDVLLLFESDIRRSVGTPHPALHFHPSIDMYETTAALVIRMELAGIQPDRIQITLSADDRILSVAGERREPPSDHSGRVRCYHLEIFFGQFERQIVLPSNIAFDRDQITANYRDGFLVLTLPKRSEPRQDKRVIKISE